MIRRPDSSDPRTARVLERFMRAMFTHLVTALARSLREHDLNLREIAALHLIDREGTLRINALAALLDLPMSAASRLADGLVEKGLIIRTESAGDRRAKDLTLSPKAAALIERTSRERVGAAFAAAASMPGVVADTIGAALQRLIARDHPPKKKEKP